MTDPAQVKGWKATEVMLHQAAELLLEPDRARIPKTDVFDFQNFIQVNELELAMLELEALAKEHGAKSGFWRRLQKAARQMKLQHKVDEYESEFHSALSR